ncbi:MAG: hypothetical protein KGS60_15925 [Verrucomicrobia bacterium]|nr:hypothetical protein [Verrucomicrobiota bacterium]
MNSTYLAQTLGLASAAILATTGPASAQQAPPPPRPSQASRQAPAQRPTMMPRIPSLPVGASQPGGPLPGLTQTELANFGAGLDEFENAETPAGGLGPIFNDVSCVSCHNAGGTGGGSTVNVTRFGLRDANGFDPLEDLGGSLLQRQAIAPGAREIVPGQANVIAMRQSTPLFGLGLIEAIPDAAILENAKRPPVNGIRGRANQITDVVSGQVRTGRFGWKAQQATILAFSADAYVNEMGVTNRFFSKENAPNGDPDLLAKFDAVADPEDTVDPATGKADIDASADFMRFLAPPQPLPLSPSAIAGRGLFTSALTDCAVCHKPSMTTGPSPVAALSKKPVNLYSDLLVHDMGSLGDGITQGNVRGNEMRTAPLWGLRLSAPYLHDGRAPGIDAAIRAHDGEAAVSREKYLRLSPVQRQQMIDFLRSL